MFGSTALTRTEAIDVSPRALAHLGDAVFHLFERERSLRMSATAKQMHTRARVSAERQAELLEKISANLSEEEQDIIRRARNMKGNAAQRSNQSAYRRATAFEALLGYLYLCDQTRLQAVLQMTLAE